MKHPIAALFAILFLLSIAVVAYLLLTKPLAVAEFATRKGFVVVFLELTRAKWGRIQVRLFGLVFLVVSIFAMAYLVLQLALGR